ncbi:MAG TPA: hypothetical protein VFK94_00930 [Patescibacteria group bacterium]|nr:hypothetical protein [Patescibacteria group bacterium]
MNINDIETDAPTEGDKLENIFDRQRTLEDTYESIEAENGFPHPPSASLDDPRLQWFLKDAAYRVVEELSEATNTLKNKPWKSSPVVTDEDHFYEEVADAFHFFIRFCIYAGLDAEKLYKLYFKKSEVNIFRQESKY